MRALTRSRRLAITVALGGLAATAAIAQAQKDKTAEPRVVHRKQLLETKPAREWAKVLRSWDLETSPDAVARLHEVLGASPRHIHPDADERIFVIEGKVHMVVGSVEATLEPKN